MEMLEVDPLKRITMQQVVSHEWFHVNTEACVIQRMKYLIVHIYLTPS